MNSMTHLDTHTIEWRDGSPFSNISHEALLEVQTLNDRIRHDAVFYHPDQIDKGLAQKHVGADIRLLGRGSSHGIAYLCGDFVEIITAESDWQEGIPESDKKEAREMGKEEKERRENDAVWRAAYRAQKQIRRIVNANRCQYMWTLTLAPPGELNDKLYKTIPLASQRDYDSIRRVFKGFVRRFRKGAHPFKWIAVFELHDSARTSDKKRGTWHIHFATPDRLEYEDIMHFWSHGVVHFDDFGKPKKGVRNDEVRNPGAYMSKYIGKNFNKTNLHRKRYTRSRDTLSPHKISLDSFLAQYLHRCEKIVFSRCDKHEYEGTTYTRISLTYKLRSQ